MPPLPLPPSPDEVGILQPFLFELSLNNLFKVGQLLVLLFLPLGLGQGRLVHKQFLYEPQVVQPVE